jgi:CP family cyanate transporter-like MFS transporter
MVPRPDSQAPFPFAKAVLVGVIGLNLRPALAGVAPILPGLMHDTGMGERGASLLGALPVLCLGVFGLLAPALARRLGLERAILSVLALLALGLAGRSAGSVPALFAGSVVAGAAIGAANVLIPALLKRDFGAWPGPISGIYVTALCLGAALGAAGAVPVAQAFGGWRGALGVWCLPALAALLLAAILLRPYGAGAGALPDRRGSRLLGRALAWQVTLYMGLQSLLAYAFFSWMAPMLGSRGDSPGTAGLVVAVSVLAQIAAALPAPLIASRMRRQSLPAAAAVLTIAVCYLGLIYAPLALQWPFSIGLGLGSGAALSLAITLILLRSADGTVAAELSGMSQGFGYSIAALGPLLVGLLHSRDGTWNGAGWVFAVVGIVAAISGALAGRPRLLHG